MEIDIDAVGQQLRMLQDQYKEKSKEYDLLYEKFNQTTQVGLCPGSSGASWVGGCSRGRLTSSFHPL